MPRPDWQNMTEVLERGPLMMDPQRFRATLNGRVVKFTLTEFFVMYALARRPGYIKSRDQIIEEAYPDDSDSFDVSVSSHIKRMRKKIAAAGGDPDIIESVYGPGYRFREDAAQLMAAALSQASLLPAAA